MTGIPCMITSMHRSLVVGLAFLSLRCGPAEELQGDEAPTNDVMQYVEWDAADGHPERQSRCRAEAAACAASADCAAYACCRAEPLPRYQCPDEPRVRVSGTCEGTHAIGADLWDRAMVACDGNLPLW
jgi:hypothetical protein